MRTRTFLPMLAALVAMSPLAAADPFRPSREDQVKLGQRAAKDIRKKEKVLPATDDRVKLFRRVASRLLAEIDDKGQPWEYSFDVIDSKEVNAFALPGGPVFFFTGLIDKMETEDQLAAVLAHEITHVRRQHWANQYAAMTRQELGISLLLILTNANSAWRDVASITNDMLFLKYSRGHENEADDGGLDLMVKAGYNPNGMADLFRILQKVNKGAGVPEFLRTHPLDSNRIKRVEGRVAKMNRTFPAQTPLPDRERGSGGSAQLWYLRDRHWCVDCGH